MTEASLNTLYIDTAVDGFVPWFRAAIKTIADIPVLASVFSGTGFSCTLGTRGNSLAKSGRPKAGKTSVRSEVSEASEAPNASSLWWRTPMVSLCLIQILYLITDWLFKNVFLPATAVGQKRSREMNRFRKTEWCLVEKKSVQRMDFIEGENLYSVSSKFEKQQERAFLTFMSRKDVFANWSELGLENI